MNKLIILLKEYRYFLIILLIIGGSYPLFLLNFIITSNRGIISYLIGIICLFYFIISKRGNFILPERNFIYFIFIFFFNEIANILLWNQSSLSSLKDLGFAFIVILIVINSYPKISFIIKFIRFNIFMGICLITGLALLSLGMIKPISIISPITNYGFFFAKVPDWSDTFIRSGGWYDEPGSLSFVFMILLLINRLYIKNKIYEYALLIIPLFTTSLAHIITLCIYIILFHLTNLRRLFIAMGFIACGFIFSSIEFENELYISLQNATVKRIENISSDGLKNDGSRTGLITDFNLSLNHLWGANTEEINHEFETKESIWYILAKYGLIGSVIYLFPFIFLLIKGLKNNNIEILKCLLIFTFNLFQRPIWSFPLLLLLTYLLVFAKYSPPKNNHFNRQSL